MYHANLPEVFVIAREGPPEPSDREPILLDLDPDELADKDPDGPSNIVGTVTVPPPFELTAERYEVVRAAWLASGRKTLDNDEVRALFTTAPRAS